MKTVNILELIGDDYEELDDVRLEQVLQENFEHKDQWARMNHNGAYVMHERTDIYERQGLTATRRTEWHNDWDRVKIYTLDEIVLTGSKKEAEAYATFLDRMITGAYD